MIYEIIMPKLGETMEEGYINKWLKNEGDRVRKGEVILEVMSDKTNFEVESQHEGFLRKILIQSSDKPVPVTTIIGYISDSMDEEIPAIAKEEKQQEASLKEKKPPEEGSLEKKETQFSTRIIASPAAKKLASEMGINLKDIADLKAGGRIEKKDVEDYALHIKEKQMEAGKKIEQLSPVRKIIADRLSWSKQNIPHYYLSTKINMNSIEQMKELSNRQGKDFTYTDFILFFVSRVIPDFPLLNTSFINGEIHQFNSIDIGIAVNTENGLVVPVLRDLRNKSIEEISILRSNAMDKARKGQLEKKDTENCRFVLTNLGMFGVMQFQAIINPPGTAIMAVGSIEKEPIISGEIITVGKTMWVTLSLDHRVIDGAYGGAFLKKLRMIMENPATALL
ncbi:MAG: 2-oxo acid dehydrogenase subunit E2 [Candidatus Omnitrophica bacterium]|nr:2-oxo acid dehydrogenase subunit E2 [Candidatus Omnitrophota bacterium]